MKKINNIINLAKEKQFKNKVIYSDLRFKKVIGKLIHLKLLENSNYNPYRAKILLDDALWVGIYEPRILELLPALFLKKPNTFNRQKNIPIDLLIVISEIRHNKPETYFRGISPDKYTKWIEYIGHKNSKPNIIKSYRFNTDDLSLIAKLKAKYKISETALIRKALKNIA